MVNGGRALSSAPPRGSSEEALSWRLRPPSRAASQGHLRGGRAAPRRASPAGSRTRRRPRPAPRSPRASAAATPQGEPPPRLPQPARGPRPRPPPAPRPLPRVEIIHQNKRAAAAILGRDHVRPPGAAEGSGHAGPRAAPTNGKRREAGRGGAPAARRGGAGRGGPRAPWQRGRGRCWGEAALRGAVRGAGQKGGKEGGKEGAVAGGRGVAGCSEAGAAPQVRTAGSKLGPGYWNLPVLPGPCALRSFKVLTRFSVTSDRDTTGFLSNYYNLYDIPKEKASAKPSEYWALALSKCSLNLKYFFLSCVKTQTLCSFIIPQNGIFVKDIHPFFLFLFPHPQNETSAGEQNSQGLCGL